MARKYPRHPVYVPIIKWQKWEQTALKQTWGDVAPFVLPCIEVRDSTQHSTLMTQLANVWPHPALVDYANPQGRLTGERPRELESFLKLARKENLQVSPVIHPLDAVNLSPGLTKAIEHFPEVVIRLRVSGLGISTKQHEQVKAARAVFSGFATPSRLIVDHATPPSVWSSAGLKGFVTSITSLKALGFDQVHLASGAFPESLASVKGTGVFPRDDWQFWKAANTQGAGLLLGYSDYGPLSPNWTEETLTRRGGRSVIRYARDKDWLILRADGNRVEHSVAISILMVGVHKASFKGAKFSYGDKLIADRADPAVPRKDIKCGQAHVAEFWTHHMATVIKEQY